MSLFKCREWWNVECGTKENYSEFSMCIGHYGDIKEKPRDILFVGSLEGYLRVYDPRPITANMQSSDMLLETQLALPILALQAGKFSYAEGLHLAVLHPRHLRVLKVNISEGSELYSYCTIDFIYEHEIPTHGYSLCIGPNWLCVQLLNDGQLIFFENERFGMTCRIPVLNIFSSPICHVSSSDSIVLSDSTWSIYSYSYQSLANSSLEQTNRAQIAGNKLLSEWELDLNGPVIDIQSANTLIVALCERYIYCVKDVGEILWTRKLDFNPMCLTLLATPGYPESHTILVASDASTVFVYRDNIVEWNSKLPFTPLMIKVAGFQGIPGMMALASDKGNLSVCYLGTQQVQYDFCPSSMRAFNYEQGQKEIQRLELMMRTGNPAKAAPSAEDIVMYFEKNNGMVQDYLENNELVSAVLYRIHLKTQKHPLKQARISFVTSPTIHSLPEGGISVQFDRNGEALSQVKFYVAPVGNLVTDSLTVKTNAVVLGAGGLSVNCSLKLPLTMSMRISTPVREARFKITLATNKSIVSVASLFKEFDPDESMTNLIALEHLNGTVVTILVSKSTNKYRLQSDSLAGLCLPLRELIERLQNHYAEENLSIALDSPVPIYDLWEAIETHYTTQSNLTNSRIKLNEAAHQFEIIQRGFHNKVLNAKSAEGVHGIFAALQIAHEYVMSSIENVQQLERELNNIARELECAICFVLSLMRFGASHPKSALLFQMERALLPVELTDTEQVWEKDVEKRLRFLLQRWSSDSSNKYDPNSSTTVEKEFQITSLKKIFLCAFDFAHKKI